jgi:hypothetical protein
LNGVSVARRKRRKPPAATTSPILASPACAPSAVQAQLVAHHDGRRVERRADLVDGAEDELLQLLTVDGDGLFQG